MTTEQDTRTISQVAVTLDDDPESFLGNRSLTRGIDADASLRRFAELVEAEIRATWDECATADVTVTGSRGSPTSVVVYTDDGTDASLADSITGMIGRLWDNSWGDGGNAWVVEIDPSTFECPADRDHILLYEDNAGNLYYECGDKVLSGVEDLRPLSGCFLRDAAALFAGEVFRPAEGLVWHTAAIDLPWGERVAWFKRDQSRAGGQLEVFGRYGHAAREALSRQNQWVITNRGQILVQRYIQPDVINRPADFELCDDEQTWNGGFGAGTSWDVIADDDPRITPEIRQSLGWVYESKD
jgi:hypothetical protein